MRRPSGSDRAPDLTPVQREILRQVYEILQFEEAAWRPLQEVIQDYHQRLVESGETGVEPAASKQLTKYSGRTIVRRDGSHDPESDSLRNLIKKVVFAVSLLFENQHQQERNRPFLAEDDLETACGSCHGSGYVQHPQWKRWWDTYLQGRDKDLPFPNVKEEMVCPECGGKGTVLTNQGRILVNGLKRHMK